MSTSRSLVTVDSSTELDPNVRYAPSGWDDGGLERDGLLATLHRHRRAILLAPIVGGLAGFLLASITPPTYRAEAQVEIRQSSPSAPSSSAASVRPPTSEQFMETQVGIIRSRSLAQKVVDSFPGDEADRLAAALAPARPAFDAAAPIPRNEVVDRLRERVGVQVSGNSRLATIRVETRDPAVSADVANRYVAHYVQTNLQRQYDSTVNSRRFLEERLGLVKSRLEASEKALNDYARSAGLIDPAGGTSSVNGASPQTLASTDLMALNQAYSQARAARISAEQRWQEASRTPLMSLPEVLNNPAIQQLTQKSAEAQAAYQQQRQSRQDTHPAVLSAAAHIKEIDRQIQTLAGSVRNSIRDQYEVSRRQEADFARTVAQLKNRTLADQGKAVRYNTLKRDADSNRQLFGALSERLNELTTAAGLVATEIAVVDRANRPAEPISPQPLLWSAIGAAIALLLALGYALVSLLRDRVQSPETIGANLHLRILGVLPKVKNPEEALADPASPLTEAHYSLRASLERIAPRSATQTILFTSSKIGEGKSTAAFGVARDFASSGKRTLLIEGDMRKPTLQDRVGLDCPLGLSTVLADLCSEEAATLKTHVPGLSVILAGPMPPSPAALLSSGAFKALMKRLASGFEVIIIDAPPVMGLADAPRMAAVAHQTVLVVEADRASLPDVRSAVQRLVDVRANVVGAILTKFAVRRSASAVSYMYDYPSAPGRPRLELA